MKRILQLIVLITLCCTGIVKAQFTRAELQVSGLSCSLCSRATERSLKKLPFVAGIKTDLLRNIYILSFRSDVPVNFDQINKIVHDSGFFVNSLKTSFNFDKVKINDNYFKLDNDTYQVFNSGNSPLNGIVELTVVDKGFAPRSVSKKYLSQATPSTSQITGRVYHLAI